MAWSWMLVTPVLVSQWRNGSTEQAWRSPCHSDFLLGGPDLRLFLRLLDLPSLSSQSLQQKAQGALPSLCARCECPCSSSSLGKQQEVFDCCSALYNPAIPTPTWTPCDWRNVVGICSNPLRHKRHHCTPNTPLETLLQGKKLEKLPGHCPLLLRETSGQEVIQQKRMQCRSDLLGRNPTAGLKLLPYSTSFTEKRVKPKPLPLTEGRY